MTGRVYKIDKIHVQYGEHLLLQYSFFVFLVKMVGRSGCQNRSSIAGFPKLVFLNSPSKLSSATTADSSGDKDGTGG